MRVCYGVAGLDIKIKGLAVVGLLSLLSACSGTPDVREVSKSLEEIKSKPTESSYFIALVHHLI